MRRGMTPSELEDMSFDLFDFQGEWFDAFDKPQTTGLYFIYGNSGNGKTSFTLKFIKLLAQLKKVAYNSLEEGKSPTMQRAFRQAGMSDVRKGNMILISEPMEDLEIRLTKKYSPDIVVLDSWQYLNMSFKQFKAFQKKFPKKLFIVISQAEGKKPKGRSANDVMYDACLKIWVEGHRAISKGRYIGKKGYFTNWIEGAAKYWTGEEI